MEYITKAHKAVDHVKGYMSIELTPDAPHLNWDGKTARISAIGSRARCNERCASLLLHELAHWVIAPPSRRNKPEFGLGVGPDATDSTRKPAMSRKYALAEEYIASLFGIGLEKRFGLDWRNTLMEHSWTVDRDTRDFSSWGKLDPLVLRHTPRILNRLDRNPPEYKYPVIKTIKDVAHKAVFSSLRSGRPFK